MKKLRLGVIGCGDIAQWIGRFARLNPRIELAACCDRSEARAAAFARSFQVPYVCTDYRCLLPPPGESPAPPAGSAPPLDAVYLAVPHYLHFEMLQAAIQAGIHALVEKPITRTLAEGQEIVRLAGEREVKVGVNYQYRYDSGCYALAQAARAGALCRLHYGRANVPWRRQADYFQKGDWRGRLDLAGGGTLLTQGSHAVDVLLWALNSPLRAAHGFVTQRRFQYVEVEDLAMGALELESGALAQVCSSMVARPEGAVTIEIYGELGTAHYSDRPYPHVRFEGVKVQRQRPPAWGLHALQRSLEGFRAWVAGGRPFLIPAEAALPALQAVEAIYHSIDGGSYAVHDSSSAVCRPQSAPSTTCPQEPP